MKKIFKAFTFLSILLSACLLTSCELLESIPGLGGNGGNGGQIEMPSGGEFDTAEQLSQIYQMAVAQGYTGTYEEWIGELKGDQIEIRVNENYIQWRYSSSSEWQNLIPLSDLEGSEGAKGDAGKSAYETYKELHPEYTGDEQQWMDDYVNGLLADINYKTHKVKFDDGCGNVNEIEVSSRLALEEPEEPKKVGHIFLGWYADDEKWNFSANVVLKDMVLEAKWVRSNIYPTVNISYIYADKTNIYFDVYTDAISQVEAITLYKDGELIETLDNLLQREFTGLLSGVEYRVEVTYSYDLNDGFGVQYQTATAYVQTQAKETPTIAINDVIATHNSISFNVDIYDYDRVAKFERVELYNGEELVDTIRNEKKLVFENLLSGTTYSGKVYYKYDYNNGHKMQEYCYEFFATTSKLNVPVVTLNNINSTQNAINAEVFIADSSQIDELISVNLYKGKDLIHSGKELKLNYTGLENNTVYTVVVEHKYDLNDGNGEIIKKDEFMISTHPVYVLLNTEILNTSAILEGEMVYIHATIDNPSNAVFTKIYINDKEYEVNASSNSKNVFAEIPSVEIGDTEFVINKFIAVLDGVEFEYYAEEENVAIAKVYEKLEVLSLGFVDKNMKPIDYANQTDDIYVKINLSNPIGYELNSMELSYGIDSYSQVNTYKGSELMKIDDNTYVVEYKTGGYGWENLYLRGITYSNDVLEKKETYSFRGERLIWLNNGVREIYTVEDLKNVYDTNDNNYTYFKLMADIDLLGIEWEGLEKFKGVFDGNGYAIKNMRISKTFTNTAVNIGLFKSGEGVIKNLSLKEMIIMVEINNNNNQYESSIGGFVARTNWNVDIKNCLIDEYSSIHVEHRNENNSWLRVGAFAGYSENNDSFINCINRANISCVGNYIDVGVFVGTRATISNSHNTGNLVYSNKNNYIYNGWSDGFIYDCYNTGALNGKYGVSLTHENYINNSISIGGKYANKLLNWEEKNYSFETNGGNEMEDITAIILSELPMPQKEGYYFYGWYDNPEFDGEAISNNYYNEEDTTLYARWIEKIDYSNMTVNYEFNPFTEQDGIWYSGDLTKEHSSEFKILANKSIRIFFDYENKIINGDGYIQAWKSSNSGTIEWKYDQLNDRYYIDLEAGDYLVAYAYRHNENVCGHFELQILAVCSLD